MASSISGFWDDLHCKAIMRDMDLVKNESPIVKDKQIELAWQKEVKKRISEVRAGKVHFIPWEEIYKRSVYSKGRKLSHGTH